MEKFNFKLEKLLEIKQKNEERAKIKQAEQKVKIEKQKEYIKSLKENLENLRKNNNIITYADIKNYFNYMCFLEEKIKYSEEKLREQELKLLEISNELIQYHKERKVVEKLKEKSYSEYIINQKKLENKINDEISVINYAKKKGGGR